MEKGEWAAGKEDSQWTLALGEDMLKNRISKKDKEERPHDAEINPRTA